MRIRAPLAIVVGAIALRLAVGIGFVNYDTGYSLVWGQQLARGQTPSYGTALFGRSQPVWSHHGEYRAVSLTTDLFMRQDCSGPRQRACGSRADISMSMGILLKRPGCPGDPVGCHNDVE